nr:hypothetical protein HK105_005778 [Polyrhizophydium stewartii]
MRAPTADTGAGGTQAQAQAQAQTQTQMLFEAQPPLLTDGDTVRELDSIRTKLALLVESLNDILMLHPATPWPPVLEQLNSIIARFESVQRELMAQSVPLALVHPHMLIPQDPDFIPRILLRTKLIPEIEDAERAAIAAYFGPAALGPASGTSAAGVPVVSAVPHADAPGPAANPVAAAFEGLFDVDPLNQAQTLKQQQEWENKVDQYEELLQAALDIFSDLRQELQETLTAALVSEELCPGNVADFLTATSASRHQAFIPDGRRNAIEEAALRGAGSD